MTPETKKPSGDELRIKSVIEKIRPFLQQEGGDIAFDSFDPATGLVKVQMIGACNGCSFAGEEISVGVARLLEEQVPAVTKVDLLPPAGTGPIPAMPFGGFYPGNVYPTIDPLAGLDDPSIRAKAKKGSK